MTQERADLELSGISKSFGGVAALHGANLRCRQREIHGLVGENGAGKSTLVKIIAGAIQPDTGEVALGGHHLRLRSPIDAQSAGIGAVHQDLGLVPDLTGAANLLYGNEPRTRTGRIDTSALTRASRAALAELKLSHIDPTLPTRSLSLPDRQLIAIARALLRRPRVLLLDEATSALLPQQVDWLFGIARDFAERGGIVLFVSHRLAEVRNLCDRVTVLRAGSDVGTGVTEEMSDDALVELMLGNKVEGIFGVAHEGHVAEDADVVCSVRDLSSPPGLHRATLDVRRGEIVGVGGLQGQGQAELFLALYGCRPYLGDVVLMGHRSRPNNPEAALALGLGYVPEDRGSALCLPLGVRDNLELGSLPSLAVMGLIRGDRERKLVDRAISTLSIRVSNPRQAVASLSGGNQQKVLLARVLASRPSLLLMYDPTRGVDVGTKSEVYRLMQRHCQEGGSILFYSSDTTELTMLCDRVVVFHDGSVVATLAGTSLSEQKIVEASIGRESPRVV